MNTFYLALPGTEYILRDHPAFPKQKTWASDYNIDAYLDAIIPTVAKLSDVLGEVDEYFNVIFEGVLPNTKTELKKIITTVYKATNKYKNLILGIHLTPQNLVQLYNNHDYIQYISKAFTYFAIIHEGPYNEKGMMFTSYKTRREYSDIIEDTLAYIIAFRDEELLIKTPITILSTDNILDILIYKEKLKLDTRLYLDINVDFFNGIKASKSHSDIAIGLLNKLTRNIEDLKKAFPLDVQSIFKDLHKLLFISDDQLTHLNIQKNELQGRYLSSYVKDINTINDYTEYKKPLVEEKVKYITQATRFLNDQLDVYLNDPNHYIFLDIVQSFDILKSNNVAIWLYGYLIKEWSRI